MKYIWWASSSWFYPPWVLLCYGRTWTSNEDTTNQAIQKVKIIYKSNIHFLDVKLLLLFYKVEKTVVCMLFSFCIIYKNVKEFIHFFGTHILLFCNLEHIYYEIWYTYILRNLYIYTVVRNFERIYYELMYKMWRNLYIYIFFWSKWRNSYIYIYILRNLL